MSLETPIKLRMLQRKLYQKAKEEPSYRFYQLYDKMYREDILAHAYALVKSNQGAPGVVGHHLFNNLQAFQTLSLFHFVPISKSDSSKCAQQDGPSNAHPVRNSFQSRM
jgi:hypothetical protein